jgi:hypothetical protein
MPAWLPAAALWLLIVCAAAFGAILLIGSIVLRSASR